MGEKKKVDVEYSPFESDKFRVNIGPQHPSTHGVLRLEAELDGEIITEVIPHIGNLHRCMEKHCEFKTYPQIIPFVDRLDYCSAINNELPYVMGVEKLLGIEVSDKVEYIRVILSELNRIGNHQIAVAAFGLDTGAFTPFLYLFRDREFIVKILEHCSGARLLYNYFWIGGLARDIYPTFKEDCLDAIKRIRITNAEIMDLLINNKIFIVRTINTGILPGDVAINFGCTGPVLRGSGVPFDLRKAQPYSIYERFDFNVCVGTGELGTIGDSWNRNIVRMNEMEESCKIIEQAIAQMPMEGDVREKVPKRVKPPKGEIYSCAENPKGELGFYIVSDGTDKPSRIKVRSTGFSNLSVLPDISKGYMIGDLMVTLGSLDIVLGDVDR